MSGSTVRTAMALLALAACSSASRGGAGPGSAGDAGSSADANEAADASPAADAHATTDAHATDAGNATADAATGDDAADAAEEPTIPPVMPGVWRDITPPSLQATAATTTPCTDLQFDPGDRTTLYAMYGGSGIWKSTDAGATWAAIGNLPTPTSLGRLRIDPGDSSHLYATGSVQGSSLGFWVSHDGGQTFTTPAAFTAGASGASPVWSVDVYNIVVDPTDFDHFLLTFHQPWSCCGEDAGILESKDGGTTFIPHAPPAGMNHGNGVAFLYDPALGLGNAGTWLVGAGYAAGLFRTSDGGTTWSSVSTLQDNHGGFDAHYSAQGYLYIGSSAGVYRSTDNGQTWTGESQGQLATWTYGVIGDGKHLYSSPAFVGQTNNLPTYVATEGGSTEGTSWTAMSAQTLPYGPWRMVFDAVNGIVYSANWSGGAWALTVVN